MKQTEFWFWGNCVLLILLSIGLFFFSPIIGSIAAFCSIAVIAVHPVAEQHRKRELLQQREQLLLQINRRAESATRQLLMELPHPCLIADSRGAVEWFNLPFGKLFPGISLSGKTMTDRLFSPEQTELVLDQRIYAITRHPLEEEKVGIVLTEITSEQNWKYRFETERPVIGVLLIDNYAEAVSGLSENDRAGLMIDLEAFLYQWAAPLCGILRKSERDRYFLVLDQQHLDLLSKEKFAVLNEIKQWKGNGDMPITLSVGIGSMQSNIAEAYSAAQAALELALGRGGDQAVIKCEDRFSFFGGNSREQERRTRVRSRVVAQGLYGLIESASDLIIMGHKHPDADCIGAALGIYSIARQLEKPARIVLGECNISVQKMLRRLNPEFPDIWLKPEHTGAVLHEQTLVVVVDIHRPALLECPALVTRPERVVLIDHHRRSTDLLSKPALMYQESYASSTSEMVAEILQYIGHNIRPNRVEAEALLAGIVLDTANFTAKTSVRTFDAASYLRRHGADPVSVQQLFRIRPETFRIISEAVEQAVFADRVYAVTVCPPGQDDMQIMPMTADQLLKIDPTEAAFVLCPHDGHVHISARSCGNCNVQTLMEQLGGGHQSSAGAMLEGVTLEEAKSALLALLRQAKES